MDRKVLIHTRKLSVPGGKQSYLLALKPYFKNETSFFYYGKPVTGKESLIGLLVRFVRDYVLFYKKLKKEAVNIVLINTSFNFKSFFRDSLFTWICFITKTPVVVFWHGWRWDFEKRYARRIKPFFHWTFGKADAMILLAEEFAHNIRKYGYSKPVFIEKTVVEEFILSHQNGEMGGKQENSILLFLSRVEKAKGIYETIDSFRKLLKKYPDLCLHIAGTGSELENLKSYVASNNISNVLFLGWVSGERKLNALKNASIFILASYSEGMPIATLEAMACGLPVVTTDVGGIKDFFEDGKMGYIVKTKDKEDLAGKLDLILANKTMASEMGKYNQKYARQNFSAQQSAERLEKIYNKILKTK